MYNFSWQCKNKILHTFELDIMEWENVRKLLKALFNNVFTLKKSELHGPTC